MIIGGGQIFSETMRDADLLELTIVHADIDGDTFFPEVDLDAWEELERELHPAETLEGPAFSFLTLKRR